MATKAKIAILGASVTPAPMPSALAARHPHVEITALTANTHAGKSMADVFPHFFHAGPAEARDLGERRLVEPRRRVLRLAARHDAGDHRGCAEGQSEDQDPRHVRDFRLRDRATYAEWYGHEHQAPELQRRRSTASPSSIATTSPRRGWWPARAATRPRRCSRWCRWPRPASSTPMTSSSMPSRA